MHREPGLRNSYGVSLRGAITPAYFLPTISQKEFCRRPRRRRDGLRGIVDGHAVEHGFGCAELRAAIRSQHSVLSMVFEA